MPRTARTIDAARRASFAVSFVLLVVIVVATSVLYLALDPATAIVEVV